VVSHSEKSKDKKSDNFSPQAIYASVSKKYRTVAIDQLAIRNGVVSGSDGLSIAQLNLGITNTLLNDSIRSWNEFYDELSIDAKGFLLNTDELYLKGETFHMNDSMEMELSNWRFNLVNEYSEASGAFENLVVKGINLDSITKQRFVFDTMHLMRPHFEVHLLPDTSAEKRGNKWISNRFISVHDGSVFGTISNEVAFQIDTINSSLMLDSIPRFQEVNMKGLEIDNLTSNNKFVISEINFSNAGDFFIKNLEVLETVDTTKLIFENKGNIPLSQLFGLNPDVLFEANKLKADSMHVEIATFDLLLNNEIDSGNVQRKSLEVEIGKVRVNVDSLLIKSQGNDIENFMVIETALTTHGFHYPTNGISSEDHLLYSERMTLNVDHIRSVFPSEDSLSFNHFFVDSKGHVALDSFYYHQKSKDNRIIVPRFKLGGLDFNKLKDKIFAVDCLQMNNPNIILSIPEKKLNEEQNVINQIQIGYFSTFGAEVELLEASDNDSYTLHNGNIMVWNLNYLNHFEAIDILNNVEAFTLSGSDLNVELPESYQLDVEDYSIQYPSKEVSLREVSYRSSFSRDEFSRSLDFQKDWIDLTINQVELKNIDLEQIVLDQKLKLDKVMLEDAVATIYRDKSIPFPEDQLRDLPQSMLQNIQKDLYLDTLQVKGSVTYQEKLNTSAEVGEISFDRIEAMLFNITNVRDTIKLEPMYLSASGELMDVAPFNVKATFYGDRSDSFDLQGQISDFPLTSLNKMLIPAAHVSITSGYSKDLTFNFSADNTNARGDMQAKYRGLKIKFLKANPNRSSGGGGFKTFLANAFVIHKNNPRLFKFRNGVVYTKRDTSRFIFNYWAKALLSGAVTSIGVNKNSKENKSKSAKQ
jgi:hypothetical protein